MSKVENNLLTPSQFTKILIFSIIGIDILSLPNDMVKYAKQDGWLVPILGLIYPLYIVFSAVFLSQKHSGDNILVLSKKYLGNVLGSIMNFIFLLILIGYISFQCVQTADFFIIYVINFLNSFQFYIIFIPIVSYTAFKGLKVLGSVSEIVFYIFILLLAITILALYRGSYLNLFPVFRCGILNIIKEVPYGIYSYSGIAVILLLFPHISDKNKVISSSVKGVLISCGIYFWFTAATIVYLGVRIMKKCMWPATYIIESLRVPFIKDFGFFSSFLLIFITIMCTSIYFYSSAIIIKDLFKSLDRKIIITTLAVITFGLCLYLSDEVKLREVMALALPISVTFNFLYVLIILLLIIIKKVGNNED